MQIQKMQACFAIVLFICKKKKEISFRKKSKISPMGARTE